MAESHSSEHPHAGAGVIPFLVVFAALAVFTVCSFAVNGFVRDGKLSVEAGFVAILGVAVVKAILVAMFFMHLKWDWGRVFFMIVAALILGTLLIIVLLPDIVLAWHYGVGS